MDEADEAQEAANIAGAWAGGHDGMAVTDMLLEQVEVRYSNGAYSQGIWTYIPLPEPPVPSRAILLSRREAKRYPGHMQSDA